MEHKHGSDRNQMLMFSLESTIVQDSPVRLIDAFVDSLNLNEYGFAHTDCKEEGRPPYHPAVLTKLYLYGYLYGIQTTRKLEREAVTNLECIWLLMGLHPKYTTIADFRKSNGAALREILRKFLLLEKETDGQAGYEKMNLLSLSAIAQNAHAEQNELLASRSIQHVDKQISAYEDQLYRNDLQDANSLSKSRQHSGLLDSLIRILKKRS